MTSFLRDHFIPDVIAVVFHSIETGTSLRVNYTLSGNASFVPKTTSFWEGESSCRAAFQSFNSSASPSLVPLPLSKGAPTSCEAAKYFSSSLLSVMAAIDNAIATLLAGLPKVTVDCTVLPTLKCLFPFCHHSVRFSLRQLFISSSLSLPLHAPVFLTLFLFFRSLSFAPSLDCSLPFC